ncbi:long-chain-alcohol oxidase FAO1-like protein [Corchorus olitorius]|uniref:Long-chain-alcohol oxidase FAO1-like protein n=1 Tax=Corchorus olitorius TaxID=93759 RepID=A0A1R3G2W0_9ROSI|nr:long-chain-alcohol oxidase FAO1-like protein [Corchorus olitorius]
MTLLRRVYQGGDVSFVRAMPLVRASGDVATCQFGPTPFTVLHSWQSSAM